jgi:hypothetical protein
VCKSLIYTLFFVLYFPKIFAFVRCLGFLLVTPYTLHKKGHDQRTKTNIIGLKINKMSLF